MANELYKLVGLASSLSVELAEKTENLNEGFSDSITDLMEPFLHLSTKDITIAKMRTNFRNENFVGGNK